MTVKAITVGIDGSPAALSACAFAIDMGQQTGASILALHAWQTPYVCTYPGGSWTPEEATNHGRRLLRDALDETGATGRVDTLVLRGMPGPTLCAESRNSDLTVVGTTGRSTGDPPPPLGEILFGSTARYLANHAAAPVATVPLGARWVDSPNVVVGIDGSPASIEALKWAVSALPESATIRAVQSIGMTATGELATAYELLDPIVEEHHRAVEQLVTDAMSELLAADRKVTSHVVLGYAHDALLDPGFDVDLIVIGRHGQTAAAEKVIGSAADHTLRNATVPVIIVPPSRTQIDLNQLDQEDSP